ncbi:MAG: guanylate kinase [Christensenellales bacterium]|jgi:guanylate kinase
MEEYRIYIISGPSGCGKGTLVDLLIKAHPEIALSVSYASRQPRKGELEGVHYRFVTPEFFKEKLARGELLEYNIMNGGNMYGTDLLFVKNAVANRKPVILEIDEAGARQVLPVYPETCCIFVLPPTSKGLVERLVGRGTETLDKILMRLEKAQGEMEAAKNYPYLLLNDDVDRASKKLIALFEGHFPDKNDNRALLQALSEEFRDMDTIRAYARQCYNEIHAGGKTV